MCSSKNITKSNQRKRGTGNETSIILYPKRRLLDTRSQVGKYRAASPEQVWADAPDLSAGAQTHTIQHSGKLFPHLWEVQEAAERRLEQITEGLLAQDPGPDKAADQLGWVQHRNCLKAQAEEIIFSELIFS